MIYLTSDYYFGRPAASIDRGFAGPEQMEDALVEAWNSVVKKEDTVYHLGNFSWDPISAETVVPFLNGKIVFMQGPYDSHLVELSSVKSGKHFVVTNGIAILRNVPHLKVPRDMVLSYWPLADWPGKEEGVIHAHGGSLATDLSACRRFNVKCDLWDMKPVEATALLDFTEEYHSQKEK